jgi:hypothetical protein
MSGLAEVVMEDKEVVEIDVAEQPRQKRIQHAPGILRREQIRGFERDQADPDHGWPPGAQETRTGCGQSISPYSSA